MTIQDVVKSVSELTGLTFTKSTNSNSFYCKERRIRISDHFSKYVERMENAFGDKTAIDLVNVDLELALKIINKPLFFSKLIDGVKISHTMPERVGDLSFISANEDLGFVTVLKLNENRIVNYDFSKININ